MKAISLWQPWASAIALGLKSVETRHWTTKTRGWIAIHAAKRWGPNEREFAAMEGLENLPLGAIVAMAFLSHVVPTEELLPRISETEQRFGNYEPGRFGWNLIDVQRLAEPVETIGRQGFWTLPDAVAEEVLRQAIDA